MASLHDKADAKYDSQPEKFSETLPSNRLIRILPDFNSSKIVTKPWGREILLNECPDYTFKRIEIKKGYETSLQYHHRKSETIFFLSGSARVVFEDSNGKLVYRDLAPGSIFETRPPGVHRVVALTDIMYVEASTPDPSGTDVIRLRDGFQRKDGRIDDEYR